jgi:UDP-N-acetylglucosamine 2-epimerase (non-hydrolysing)
MKIALVAGARPNFMKIAPLVDSLKTHNRRAARNSRIGYFLVHTGQHYDESMSGNFFRQLKLPEPDIYLGAGSGTHAVQTAKIMVEFEKACCRRKPDLVTVVGDVNSTLACALVAAKLRIPFAHIEAGLRSQDRTMPEEINRIVIDHLSDFLFTTCRDADNNLLREGIPAEKIHFVGNVMIDALKKHIGAAGRSKVLKKLGLVENGGTARFALLTLHRPSNVDNPEALGQIFSALVELSERLPIVFPLHPRTRKQIEKNHLDAKIRFVSDLAGNIREKPQQGILGIPPLGYLDFLALMSRAAFVLTDSGGIQEETTILGIPCLTLRANTERPITITEGTNQLVGHDPEKIKAAALEVMSRRKTKKKNPKFWDGRASSRIVKVLSSLKC